jgi:NAD(P)-dependent dehydrogenase (short-subunit alcohol dehydrogenase family)
MTRAIAREWGRFNVNVNAVAFGLIHTRMTSADANAGATVNIEGREIRVGLNPKCSSRTPSATRSAGRHAGRSRWRRLPVLLAGFELHHGPDHRRGR